MVNKVSILFLSLLPLVAMADVNFYVTNNRDPKNHMDRRYVSFYANKLNSIHKAQIYWEAEGDTNTSSTTSSLFAPDPGGAYNIAIYCNLDRQETNTIKQMTFVDGDAAYFNVTCSTDDYGHLLLPTVTWDIQHAPKK